jgi:hypothetical protein
VDRIELAENRLRILLEASDERPEEILRAVEKLKGVDAPDPVWQPPGERRRMVSSIASSVGLNPKDLLLLLQIVGQ